MSSGLPPAGPVMSTEGAREHIATLSRRYVGREYPGEIRTERVLLRIRPDRVITGG